MKRFEVLDGKHVGRDGTSYKKGDIVEHPGQLDEVFPNKFRKVSDAPVLEAESSPVSPAKGKKGAQVVAPKAVAKTPGAKPDADKDARGWDASETFPKAAEEGFKVFARGDLFHVYEGANVKPINPKGLKKADVDAFVKTYLEE